MSHYTSLPYPILSESLYTLFSVKRSNDSDKHTLPWWLLQPYYYQTWKHTYSDMFRFGAHLAKGETGVRFSAVRHEYVNLQLHFPIRHGVLLN